MIQYERLLSYGNCFALAFECSPSIVLDDISRYTYRPYNSKKSNNPRFGISLTSIDGGMKGDDLTSLYELNQEGVECNEMSFRTFTDLYYTSPSIRQLVEPFKDHLGRSHILKLDKGGYFPPHRDDRGQDKQDVFRVIIPLANCLPPSLYFHLNSELLHLEHGVAYFINTNCMHSLFSFNQSIMLILNIEFNEDTMRTVISNMRYV